MGAQYETETTDFHAMKYCFLCESIIILINVSNKPSIQLLMVVGVVLLTLQCF